MPNWLKWIIGIIGCFIIAWGLSKFNPFHSEDFDWAEKTEAAVTESVSGLDGDYSWLSTDVVKDTTGAAKFLVNASGVAPDEASKDAAISAIKNAKCDCPWGLDAKKHRVNADGITIKPSEPEYAAASPYVFAAITDEGPVTLSGSVPNLAMKASVIEEARTLFAPRAVIDNLQLASGQPDGDWRNILSIGMSNLAKLKAGEFRITDATAILTGRGDEESDASGAASAFAAFPSPFVGVAEVEVPNVTVMAPQVTSTAVCQALFDQIKGDARINFQTGSSIINEASHNLLDRLAAAANRCQTFRVDLVGHTDAVGDASLNQQLSTARARAALDYLVSQGVAREQLTFVGYGQTQPVASNDTAEGRARNRRIDFNVVEQSN